MKTSKKIGLGLLTLGLTLTLAACGSGGKDKTDGSQAAGESSGEATAKHSAVIVTDIGGVDDKSFNQSAWEGLKAWGEENNLSEGADGFAYIQSDDASAYTTNMDQAVSNGFGTIFGVGYLLKDAVTASAQANPDTNYGIIDDTIDGLDNVVSATFKDHEASYLAGVAAAYTTKTDHVGFVGGEEGVVIDRFEAGFVQGVKETAEKLKKEIKVDVKYAASFGDPAKGKALAAAMYQAGADIIFHASGGTGTGVFQEAKAINETGDQDKVWVIGVDRDQDADGEYKTKDGEADNFTLTSTLKGVGAAVHDISNRALKGEFPGGEHLVYGLKDGGVELTEGYVEQEAKDAVQEAKEQIIAEEIVVNETPEK